jgi:succinyl-CoA synthetase beta subunit
LKLDSQSTASLSLTVFNEDASIFTLLSGGGASLVVLDSFVDTGLQAMVGNYGEYSGAPSQEETKIYTDVLLSLLFASKAPRKVLVIAGGVANFTDITTTFRGVVDSCKGYLDDFKKQGVLVVVRRGGPRQAEGLALLRNFFAEHNIEASVSDASEPLSQVAVVAKTFLEKTL